LLLAYAHIVIAWSDKHKSNIGEKDNEFVTMPLRGAVNVRPPCYASLMFIYLITLNDERVVRVESDTDPTDHPAFYGRVVNVETLGEVGKHLSLVSY